MGDENETASPSAAPPPEPQHSVHSQPEDPADGGPVGGGAEPPGPQRGGREPGPGD